MTTLNPKFRTGWLFMAAIIVMGVSAPFSYSADEYKVLEWEDLMPKDWNPNSVYDKFTDEEFSTMGIEQYTALQEEAQAMLDIAPTVDALDGEKVKIPGFMLPLEFDESQIKEFLLVPYFGACTHTPPPPANQVILGKLASAFTLKAMFEPVWITGKLSAIRSKTTLDEAGVSQTIDVDTGYTMEVDEITPYEE